MGPTTVVWADGPCPNPGYAWTGTTHSVQGYSGGRSVAVADSQGAILVGGFFTGVADLDPTSGVDLHTSLGLHDAYVTRLSPDGSYAWTVTYGGESIDNLSGMVVDHDGNIVLTGGFQSSVIDLDPGSGEANFAQMDDSQDAYVSKLDAQGNFLWGGTFSGTGYVFTTDVAIAPDGGIFVVGFFNGTSDFDPTEGVDEHTDMSPTLSYNAFVTRLNGDGSYGWTRTFLGPGTGYGTAVALDAAENVYVEGAFTHTVDFDPGVGVDRRRSNGSFDVFITKLTSGGNYVWTRTFGGKGYDGDFGNDLAVSPDGRIWLASTFRSVVDFDPSAGVDFRSAAGELDAFVTKLSSDGAYEGTVTFGGPQALTIPHAIAVDGSGNRFLTGEFRGTVDFDPTHGTDMHSSPEYFSIFLTELPADGTYGWTVTTGSEDSYDAGVGLALDPAHAAVYSTGYFTGTADFDFGPGADLHTAGNYVDSFVTKVSCNP
jgi:hypothetical protein